MCCLLVAALLPLAALASKESIIVSECGDGEGKSCIAPVTNVLLQRKTTLKHGDIMASGAEASLVASYSRVQNIRQRESEQIAIIANFTIDTAIDQIAVIDSLPAVVRKTQLVEALKNTWVKLLKIGTETRISSQQMLSGSTDEFEAGKVRMTRLAVSQAIHSYREAVAHMTDLAGDLDATVSDSWVAVGLCRALRTTAHSLVDKFSTDAASLTEAALKAVDGSARSLLELDDSELSGENMLALQQEIDEVAEALRLEENWFVQFGTWMSSQCRQLRDNCHIVKLPGLAKSIEKMVDRCMADFDKLTAVGSAVVFEAH